MEINRGRITSTEVFRRRSPYPINVLQNMAMMINRSHAAAGNRFHQAA